MNQEQFQQTLELLKSMNAQLVSLNERMVKVENALANSSAEAIEDEGIIPVRYHYDEIKEKHIKITVTTKLIRDALEEANLDKDPKHVYKSMQKAAASQARRLLLSVYEGKRVCPGLTLNQLSGKVLLRKQTKGSSPSMDLTPIDLKATGLCAI